MGVFTFSALFFTSINIAALGTLKSGAVLGGGGQWRGSWGGVTVLFKKLESVLT